jgi:hypothetical protein
MTLMALQRLISDNTTRLGVNLADG